MTLETERQYIRCAAMVLLARLQQHGGIAIGFPAGPPVGWLMGEIDNIIEMRMILEGEGKNA